MTTPLLINEPPLQVLPSLARAIGLNEAIVLQQVHYWLNPRFNKNVFEGKYWVHNTFKQWQQQFSFWNERTIQRIVASLEESQYLVSFITKDFRKTKYYTVNYDALNLINLGNSEDAIFSLSKISQKPNLEKNNPNALQTLGKPLLDASRQNNPIVTAPYRDQSPQTSREREDNPLNSPENQEIHPLRQIVVIDTDKLSSSMPSGGQDRHRQGVVTDDDKVSASHTENTPENTTEITLLPPLPLSCPSSAQKGQGEKEREGWMEKQEEENKNIKIKSEKQQVFHHLLKIWNQTVQNKFYSGWNVCLNEKRERLLSEFLETVLRDKSGSAKIEGWQDYCNLIAQSKFLGGNNVSGFKATLDWALIPQNAYKILEGAIYDKPEATPICKDKSWQEFFEEIKKILPSSPYRPEWLQISWHLAQALGQAKYKSWFSKIILQELTQTRAVFQVEGRFIRDYITTHFLTDLKRAIQAVYPTVFQIDLEVITPERNGRVV